MLRVTMLRFLTNALVDDVMNVKIVDDLAYEFQSKGRCFEV